MRVDPPPATPRIQTSAHMKVDPPPAAALLTRTTRKSAPYKVAATYRSAAHCCPPSTHRFPQRRGWRGRGVPPPPPPAARTCGAPRPSTPAAWARFAICSRSRTARRVGPCAPQDARGGRQRVQARRKALGRCQHPPRAPAGAVSTPPRTPAAAPAPPASLPRLVRRGAAGAAAPGRATTCHEIPPEPVAG